VLGILIVGLIFYLPNGIVGAVARRFRKRGAENGET